MKLKKIALLIVVWNMFVSAAVGFCSSGGDHSRLARRRPHGQLLPRHVAGGRLRLPARRPDRGRAPDGRGRADDVRRRGQVQTVERIDGHGEDGRPLPQISRGPVAAIMPIKHLGTNGGGFFGANSAHPFENPNAWTNFLTVSTS